MRTLITLMALLPVTAACAQPSPTLTITDLGYLRRSSPTTYPSCPVMVMFNSACCGINGAALQTIRTHLQTASGIASVTQFGWGREGEKTLCIIPQTPADTTSVVSGLQPLIPTTAARNHATVTLKISPLHQ